MTLSKALEMYVKVIHKLECEQGKGKATSVTEIAEEMDVKPPSVTDALQRLDKLGMVKYEKYHGVRLTKKGKKVAQALACRYETLRDFLVLLGVPEEIASADACEIEHLANSETVRRLTMFVHFMKNSGQSDKWMEQFQEFMKSEVPPKDCE